MTAKTRIITTDLTTIRSREEMPWNTSRPSPGRKNTFSMMMAPASRNENCRPMMVSTGISALRRAWRHSVCRRVSPLARAERM
jgi:hypothetical protein